MKKSLWVCFTICFYVLFFGGRPVCAQELTINFVAVNASETETKTVDVKEYLPKELDPSDIVDQGGLEIDYDVDKQLLYVHNVFEFKPGESKTFKVRVKDVWRVSQEEVDLLKDQLSKNLEGLKDHESYESALFVGDELMRKMDYILQRQEEFQGNIGRRIEEFRANKSELDQIRDNVYSQDFLKYESKSIEEELRSQKTVKFVIEVQNPSADKAQTLTHKHYLPERVRADHVIEKQGFDVRFDEKKDRAYLVKEEDFGPGERKKYEIVIKDIWEFPDIKVQDLDDRAQIATLELEGTEFKESADRLFEQIKENLNLIRESKNLVLSVKQHIGLYKVNQERFDRAFNDFKRIEEMISIVRAKKLAEYERKKVKNVLERLKALRGLKSLSEALFKKRISANLAWKIIGGTIAFVALFSTYHFLVWSQRSKRMGEELGPPPGEGISVVPKPGEEEEEEE